MPNDTPPSKTIGVKLPDTTYHERRAVRLVLHNDAGELAILHARAANYYKLPGGGIEADEDHCVAAQREALEETGCKVSVQGGCFAEVEEWRGELHQVSYCYIARLEEDTGATGLTADEVQDGLRHEWVAVDAALDKMRDCQPTSELGRSIKERDIFFVEVYRSSS